MNIIKKGAGYLLTYGGATIFAYEIFNAGIYFYSTVEDKLATASLIRGLYLPIVFACFGLAILLLTQTKWVKVTDKKETMIYGIFNIVFFLLILALAIIMAVLGAERNAGAFGISSIPLFALSLLEMAFGVAEIIRSNKTPEEEVATEVKAAPKEEPKK